MRTITIHKNLFKFSELPANIQSKALDKMRENDSDFSFHAECVIDDAKTVGLLMGIDISKVYYSGFSSQGDGACFDATYQHVAGSLEAIEKYAPLSTKLHRIASNLAELQVECKNDLRATIKQRGRYMHSGCTEMEVYLSASQYDYTTDEIDGQVKELMRDFMDWIYSSLSKEYDYVTSDEYIKESIEANDYEFDERGCLV